MNPLHGTKCARRTQKIDEDIAEEMEVEEHNECLNHEREQLRTWDGSILGYVPPSGETSLRPQARERKHAALSILMDPELLLFHAMSNNESIPQARRRFLHHFSGTRNPDNYSIAVIKSDKSTTGFQGTLRGPTDMDTDTDTATITTLDSEFHTASGSSNSISRKGTLLLPHSKLPRPVVDIIETQGGWKGQAEDKTKRRVHYPSGEAGPSSRSRKSIGSPRK